MADNIIIQTIPDCKMLRSPEAENPGISKYLKAVHADLAKIHENKKILGIVPVVFEGTEYYLVGTMAKGSLITAENLSNIRWAPFARLLTMKEWKKVLQESGARLRYCTPVENMLYDPYRAVEVVSTTPLLRTCTIEARMDKKPIDLLAVYTGMTSCNAVEWYLPFAMIISELEAAKLWTQGFKDITAIKGDRFLKDKGPKAATNAIALEAAALDKVDPGVLQDKSKRPKSL